MCTTHWQEHRWRGAAIRKQLRNRRSWRDGASGENPQNGAREVNADPDRSFGAYHPSLDEMVSVAKEMERRGFTIPLLIGGNHFESAYGGENRAELHSGPTVYVQNASRTVGVVAARYSPTTSAMTSPVPAKSTKPCVFSTPAKTAYAAGHAGEAARDNFDLAFDWERYARR